MQRGASHLGFALRRTASPVRAATEWTARWIESSRCDRLPRRDLGAAPPTDVAGARSPKLARLEAALFATAEPLSTKRLADIANLLDGNEARTLLDELKRLYDGDGTAFTVEQIAGGWQLRARREFAPWLAKLHGARHEPRLSQPALEALAVIAYRQPVLRTDVEVIRGVQCGEMLRQLIERGFIRIVGHHDSLGRPLLYGTTRKFLEVFGLADLSELPLADQLRMPADHSRPAVKPVSPETEVAVEPDAPAS